MIIWLVGMLAIAGDMLFTLILFFVAIAVSVGVIGLPAEKTRTWRAGGHPVSDSEPM